MTGFTNDKRNRISSGTPAPKLAGGQLWGIFAGKAGASFQSSSGWLAIDDPLHDAHPSLVESQGNVADNAFFFLEFDNKSRHHQCVIRAFASLARFPKPYASKGTFGFSCGGFLRDRVNRLRDLRCEARHHILAQLISPILPTNLFLNRHVLHFQLATVALA